MKSLLIQAINVIIVLIYLDNYPHDAILHDVKEAFWISKQFSQLHSTVASLNILTQQESKTEKTVLRIIINRFIYSEIMIICQQ